MTDQKPQLGMHTDYPAKYSPELLVAIPRAESRAKLPMGVPFLGVDTWTAYELSWLDANGKPQVAIGEFTVPCESPHIVESKSFKLYLNSMNQEKIGSREQFRERLIHDLSNGFGAEVSVNLFALDEYAQRGITGLPGDCIDGLDVACDVFTPDVGLLSAGKTVDVTETLHSHLLKTNCPVTGQPDWASICISYSGRSIDRKSLLRYLVSFRNHQDFHENCVERIYTDIVSVVEPHHLSIFARYTRRGGLDINPYRTSYSQSLPPWVRVARQ